MLLFPVILPKDLSQKKEKKNPDIVTYTIREEVNKTAINVHSVSLSKSQQAKLLKGVKVGENNRNLLFIDQLLIDGEIVGIYCAFWSIP